MKRIITAADLLSPQEYAKRRSELRKALIDRKKKRRVEVGPFATFYFECFETMLAQVQEMLHIEKGGEEQLADELAAYNPLIPQGRELVATLMFEIPDPDRRLRELSKMGGIEHRIFMKISEEEIIAEAEGERTNEQGKTSSVHFLHFRLNDSQAAKFRAAGAEILLGFHHQAYGHMARMPEEIRQELSKDL